MSDETPEERAALHALGLLEGDELTRFRAELARDPALRAQAAALAEAAAALAHLAPEEEPPAALKARVLASAGAPAGRAPVVPFPNWVPWLAAACLAGAALWSGRRAALAEARGAALEAQRTAAETALADARRRLGSAEGQVTALSQRLREEGDLARFKIATLASMLGNSPAAVAVAVWDPSREEGVLSVSKLPAAATGKDYQLWVVDPDYASPVSAGTFTVDPATGEAHIVFRADKPVARVAKFAVSLERKGGVPKAEGPIVLLSP